MLNSDIIGFELGLRSRRAAFGFPTMADGDVPNVVAMSGDLSPERLLVAYANGIFPWPHPDIPHVPWCSPSPRTVLVPGAIHVGKSTIKAARREGFQISFDTAFHEVITACAMMNRKGEAGTWITEGMIAAYVRLHELGFAHSAETWREGRLVGGVYGVCLGAAFFGESMFRHEPNASKVALLALLQRLEAWDFKFMDCQMRTPIANSFGAVDWDRATFQAALVEALGTPTRREGWR